MASRKVFIDTSGFYALLVRNDIAHSKAVSWMQKFQESGHHAVTSDYVMDETSTLFKARGAGHLAEVLFDLIEQSSALTMHYIDEPGFLGARDFFLKHHDKTFSFTDCTSFTLMRKMGIKEALTTDHHFIQAGYAALLAY